MVLDLHQSLLIDVGTSLLANHLSHKPEDYSQEGAVPASPGGLFFMRAACIIPYLARNLRFRRNASETT